MVTLMRVHACFIAFLACVFLSGCSSSGGFASVKDKLTFWSKEDDVVSYEVSGLDHDEETKAFVQTILNQQKFDNLTNEDERAYAQQVVQSNVEKALKSKGYYGADVELSAGQEENAATALDITTGDITRIKTLSIRPEKYALYKDALTVNVGDPLDASKVLVAQSALYKMLQKENCAFSLSVKNRVSIDTDNAQADVIFDVVQGRAATFGDISFTGQETIDESYLNKLVQIEKGSCFQREELQNTRDKVMGSGLFSRVETVLPQNVEEETVIPVEFSVKERPHRTISAGLNYYTDDGIGVILGWQHRNFFGSAEKLDAKLKLSTLEQSLEVGLTKPYFMRDDQSLLLNASVDREDTDAYEKLGIGVGAGVKRQVSKHFSWRTGLNFELSQITEENEENDDTFALLKPYAGLSYDTRDDALDPHKGWLIGANISPVIDAFSESDPYIRSDAQAQTYYEAHKRLVLAARAKLGSIVGASADNLPATERFFSGGGGSVRGFGFQEIGPFEDGDPLGGRSVFETALEARFKVSETLGGVVFVDAGQVSDEVTPSFNDIAIGAGAGFRYYTGFGPLRFDVGVPLSGDNNTDAPFQIYISIGQAF